MALFLKFIVTIYNYNITIRGENVKFYINDTKRDSLCFFGYIPLVSLAPFQLARRPYLRWKVGAEALQGN